MRFAGVLLAAGAALALGGLLPAQCTVTNVTFTPYGAACNTVFGVPPGLSGTWAPQSCTARLSLSGFPGCCNTYLVQRYLAIGLSSANIPVPQIGPSCVLYVQPDLILTNPGSLPDFDFILPVGLPPVTVYAQGANVYFTTIGFSYDAELTNGLAVAIQ